MSKCFEKYMIFYLFLSIIYLYRFFKSKHSVLSYIYIFRIFIYLNIAYIIFNFSQRFLLRTSISLLRFIYLNYISYYGHVVYI